MEALKESSGPQIDFGRTPCLAYVAYFKELVQRLPCTVSDQHTRKKVTHTISVLQGPPRPRPSLPSRAIQAMLFDCNCKSARTV